MAARFRPASAGPRSAVPVEIPVQVRRRGEGTRLVRRERAPVRGTARAAFSSRPAAPPPRRVISPTRPAGQALLGQVIPPLMIGRQARHLVRQRQAEVQRGPRPVVIVGAVVQFAQPPDDIVVPPGRHRNRSRLSPLLIGRAAIARPIREPECPLSNGFYGSLADTIAWLRQTYRGIKPANIANSHNCPFEALLSRRL